VRPGGSYCEGSFTPSTATASYHRRPITAPAAQRRKLVGSLDAAHSIYGE
jgi:hypothetical protein